MIDKAKSYFQIAKKYLTQQAIIIRYKQKVKKGQLSTDSEIYQQYVAAVWQSTYIKNKYKAFQIDYDSYFKPLSEADARKYERKHEQILLALQSPHLYVLTPQGELKEAKQRVVNKTTTETRPSKSEQVAAKRTKKTILKQNTHQAENNNNKTNQEGDK